MPWKVRKRKCRQGDGDKGKYVVVKVKRGGGTKQSSCHTSKKRAQAATRARYASAYGESVMKITAGQLRQIIREELTQVLREHSDQDTVDIVDVETGEVLYVGAGTQRGIPAAKVDDFIRDLKLSVRGEDKDGTERSIELSKADFEKLEAHIDDVYDRPEREKAAASRKADQERLDPRRLKDELSRRAKIAGEEYMADNPDGNLDDVALDLGRAVLDSFERDEQEELRYAFDDDEYQLSLYAAESM